MAAMLVALIVLFCGTAGAMLLQLRHDAWNSAARGAENLLAAVSQEVARTVQSFDLSLEAVIDGLQLPGVANMPVQMRRAVLFDRAATAPYLGAIQVLDEKGVVIEDAADAPQPGSLAEQQFFRTLRDAPHDGLFVSGPFGTDPSEKAATVIALARRINRLDGSFGGVVAGTLRLDYFKDLFARFSLGRDGTVGLARTDGVLLMRLPFDQALVGRNVADSPAFQATLARQGGTWTGVTPLDGMERTLFFAHVPGLPLILTVALSPHDIYEAWNGRATVIAVLLLLLCSVATVLFALLHRELQRRDEAERRLRDSTEQYRLLADHATDVTIRLGPDMVRRYVSPSSVTVLGFRPDELLGRSPRELVHAEDWPGLVRELKGVVQERGRFTAEYRIRHKDGRYVWVEGRCNSLTDRNDVMIVLRDVTARKEAECRLAEAHAELTRLATTDGLTGLANRRHLDDTLAREWRRAARESQPVSLLMLDIDLFKQFNDHYGHGAGDTCLQAVGRTLATHARRAPDLAARYGGEEFVLLLPGIELAQAVLVGELVRNGVARLAIAHTANVAHAGVVTVSIGVATAYPQSNSAARVDEPATLALAADQALYDAKRGGRNRIAWPQTARQDVEPAAG